MENVQEKDLVINRYFELNGLTVRAMDFEGLNSLFNEIKNLKPILLTEEWFIKFGFQYNGYPDSLSLKVLGRGILNAYSISDKPRIEIGTASGYIFGETKIKYVHELQNLFFALTKKELI